MNGSQLRVSATSPPLPQRHASRSRPVPRSLLGSFTVFIIMGILGEFAGSARSTVIALCVVAFLLGMASFAYSRWIEQPGIRLGADAVKKLLDEKINPRYERSEYKLRWAVRLCGGGGEVGGGAASVGSRRRTRCFGDAMTRRAAVNPRTATAVPRRRHTPGAPRAPLFAAARPAPLRSRCTCSARRSSTRGARSWSGPC